MFDAPMTFQIEAVIHRKNITEKFLEESKPDSNELYRPDVHEDKYRALSWDFPGSLAQTLWFFNNFGYYIHRDSNTGFDTDIHFLDDFRCLYIRENRNRFPNSPYVDKKKQMQALQGIYDALIRVRIDILRIKVKTKDESEVWKLHEFYRFGQGTYEDIPPQWRERSFTNDTALDPACPLYNFPHISTSKPGILAFTASDDKGRRDIQTPMKPGKYLKQFLGEKLNKEFGENKANAIIAEMAAEFGNYSQPDKLMFAKTADEIERVYTNGPSSCMSHLDEDYSGSEHPVRAFAAGDLQVAYIERKKNEGPTARALVWPEKKVWTRIYGDKTRITPLLKEAGYRLGDDQCLNGAKLAKIEDENNDDHFIMPYVDHHQWAKESKDGSHFIIDPEGHVYLQNTGGTSDNGFECAVCESRGRSNNCLWLRIGRHSKAVCQECYDNNTVRSDFDGHRYMADEMVEMVWGGFWYKNQFRDYGFTCGFDGKRYPRHSNYTPNAFRREAKITPHMTDLCVVMFDGSLWFINNFKEHGKTTKDGRNITLPQWESELRKELEDAGQLTFDMGESTKKKIIAKKKREEEAAIMAAEAEREKSKGDMWINPISNTGTVWTSFPITITETNR